MSWQSITGSPVESSWLFESLHASLDGNTGIGTACKESQKEPGLGLMDGAWGAVSLLGGLLWHEFIKKEEGHYESRTRVVMRAQARPSFSWISNWPKGVYKHLYIICFVDFPLNTSSCSSTLSLYWTVMQREKISVSSCLSTRLSDAK
jgi:hypothetical protein